MIQKGRWKYTFHLPLPSLSLPPTSLVCSINLSQFSSSSYARFKCSAPLAPYYNHLPRVNKGHLFHFYHNLTIYQTTQLFNKFSVVGLPVVTVSWLRWELDSPEFSFDAVLFLLDLLGTSTKTFAIDIHSYLRRFVGFYNIRIFSLVTLRKRPQLINHINKTFTIMITIRKNISQLFRYFFWNNVVCLLWGYARTEREGTALLWAKNGGHTAGNLTRQQEATRTIRALPRMGC